MKHTFTYTDSISGFQSEKFQSLLEIIKHIESFKYIEDSEGIIYISDIEFLCYISTQNGINYQSI